MLDYCQHLAFDFLQPSLAAEFGGRDTFLLEDVRSILYMVFTDAKREMVLVAYYLHVSCMG